jgi:hypothetical protein
MKNFKIPHKIESGKELNEMGFPSPKYNASLAVGRENPVQRRITNSFRGNCIAENHSYMQYALKFWRIIDTIKKKWYYINIRRHYGQ